MADKITLALTILFIILCTIALVVSGFKAHIAFMLIGAILLAFTASIQSINNEEE